MNTDKDNINKFLTRLNELAEEFGITIAGCGCDKSPWLVDRNGKPIKGCGDLSYSPDNGYHFLSSTEYR